ncbi:ABC transporter permease subunit [Aquabacterium sp. A3]|uniref:ABC transporter permease subunit n=1 Tax=Aquabacterium sp. A3 TaxID=3132829 RepID=UPI003119E2A8
MWDFLFQPAGFDIGETGLLTYSPDHPLWWAFLVGLGNTLRVALPGLILCTALALVVALLQRHGVGVWRGIARAYVELVRNVPLLLQLLIWYFLVVEALPDTTDALELLPGWWLSKGGLAFPWPVPSSSMDGAAAADMVQAVGWHWSVPEQGPFNVTGGASLSPEYLALLMALSVYTSAFLAEIIRAGFDAVPVSLLEAADTLGATRWQQVAQVLLPQALRTIVPGATNQYLNLVKNSTLAVAIGYPDLVSISNTTINQTGQVLSCLLIMMGVYLTLSLLTAAGMNLFNRRQALKGVAS